MDIEMEFDIHIVIEYEHLFRHQCRRSLRLKKKDFKPVARNKCESFASHGSHLEERPSKIVGNVI